MRSTHNGRRACIIRCMNVDEAREVYKDRSRWHFVVPAYPHGKKACVYLCMNFVNLVATSASAQHEVLLSIQTKCY